MKSVLFIMLCALVSFFLIGCENVKKEKELAVYSKKDSSMVLTETKKREIIEHVNYFHSLFFEINPSTHEERVAEALNLIDVSGKDLYLALRAKKFYENITTLDLNQHLEIESISILNKNPCKVEIKGTLKMMKSNTKSLTSEKIEASFDIVNVQKSDKNPNGLLIKNYKPKMKY